MENNAPDALWAHLTPKTETKGVKLRLAHVFKKVGQTSMDVMNEMKSLSSADLADFATWFTSAGYPTTYSAT